MLSKKLMTAMPTLLRNQLTMSLPPKDSLFRVLEVVAKEQAMAGYQLSLAIPLNEILSYYAAQLVTDTLTIDEDVLMTLAISFASKQHSEYTSCTEYLCRCQKT